MRHTYIHIGSTCKTNPFRDIFNKGIFHGIPKETSVFIIDKVTLPRSSKGSSMVGRHTKGGRELFNRWLHVYIVGRGTRGSFIEQINRVGRSLGTSQWTQQEKVLRPIWTDSIFDNGRGR